MFFVSTGPNEHDQQSHHLHADHLTDPPTHPGYTGATVLPRAATHETKAWLPLREKQHLIRIDMGFSAKSVGASVMVSASKTQNPKRHS
jgi:hypothetical protein